jgi:8-oxo-dGTP pyrophosphatase MutT (NUDIX family)
MDEAGVIARLSPLLLTTADAITLEPPGEMESAVLVPLTLKDGRLSILFTRRPDDMRRHAGEYSFPGGRRDENEGDLLATALRETEEEVGIREADVAVIGALQPTATIATGFSVHPFVALVPEEAAYIAEPAEVAELIVLDAFDLMCSVERRRLTRKDASIRTSVYPVGDRFIWGATGRILADLFDRIGPILTEQ